MKVTNVSLNNYYGDPSGTFSVTADDVAIAVTLKGEEINRLVALCLEIFDSRKSGVAQKISTMTPQLLADFSEVSPPVPHVDAEEVPF